MIPILRIVCRPNYPRGGDNSRTSSHPPYPLHLNPSLAYMPPTSSPPNHLTPDFISFPNLHIFNANRRNFEDSTKTPEPSTCQSQNHKVANHQFLPANPTSNHTTTHPPNNAIKPNALFSKTYLPPHIPILPHTRTIPNPAFSNDLHPLHSLRTNIRILSRSRAEFPLVAHGVFLGESCERAEYFAVCWGSGGGGLYW